MFNDIHYTYGGYDMLQMEILQNIRKYFDESDISLIKRITCLKRLREVIKQQEHEVINALYQDIGKPEFEAFASEIAPIYHEIDLYIKNLTKWVKPQNISTPLSLFYSKSHIQRVPLGCVLIIAPWNYPFNLAMSPLIGAIAAGNCVVLKPSEISTHTSIIIEEIIKAVFEENHVLTVLGDGAVVVPNLINAQIFNHVFFTGSTVVGQIVASLCAKYLIPYTLELGGKSPAIIDDKVNLKVAIRRLVWGKFFNAGQTCIAPDYVLVHNDIKPKFICELEHAINNLKLYEDDNFAKIINSRQFIRLKSYLKMGEVLIGGKLDESKCKIYPTVIGELSLDSEIMQNEIFGPILPIISYDTTDELINIVRRNRYPLAMYIFSNDSKFTGYLVKKIEAGAVGINSCLYHFVNSNLPFGGVMRSGIGQYHGKYTFDLFTHPKSIVKTSIFPDLWLRYPPYTKIKNKLLRLINNI